LQAPTYVRKNPLTKYGVVMDNILLAHFPTQSSTICTRWRSILRNELLT